MSMLTVIIATAGTEHGAVATLSALVPGAAAGVIQEVILVETAPSADIERVADVAGCRYLLVAGSRTDALAEAARQARAPWLLFLQPGTVLDPGWIDEATRFIQTVSLGERPRAGVFRFARSPYGEGGWRGGLSALARNLGGPRPDQGLLIAREHYDRIGGHDAARSEAALLRRLGRARAQLRSGIVRV